MSDLWSILAPLNPFDTTVQGGVGQFLANPAQWWDYYKNGQTNTTNAAIAKENLEYQEERNQVEDARYEEETAYNRAFAKDEQQYNRSYAEEQRDYERALQQQIFDREDTALERQAQSLSALGINPLSQQLNGLGAGQAVSSSLPTQSVAPSMSSRGGIAKHNDFRMTDTGILNAITPIMSLIDGVNGVMTGRTQRDSLRAQRDGQILENQAKAIDNLIKASENDVKINDDGSVSLNREFTKKKQDFNEVEYTNANASANRNAREDFVQENYGGHDNMNTYAQLATDTAYNADRAQQQVQNMSKEAINALGQNFELKMKEEKERLKNNWNSFWNDTKSNFKKAGSKVRSWFLTPNEMEKRYRR